MDALPTELVDHILYFTENDVSELCSLNKYINYSCKVIRVNDNLKRPDLDDKHLEYLINMETLYLHDNRSIISHDGIPKIITDHVSLTRLDITNKGLFKLSNLTSLDLSGNSTITDQGISKLFALTNLNLSGNKYITNQGILLLTNLVSLNLKRNNNITDEGISKLINLVSLNISFNETITDQGISNLTNLTSLNLQVNVKITNQGLENLNNITSLNLSGANCLYRNPLITNEGLHNLYSLVDLDLSFNRTITKLPDYIKLETINLYNNDYFPFLQLIKFHGLKGKNTAGKVFFFEAPLKNDIILLDHK